MPLSVIASGPFRAVARDDGPLAWRVEYNAANGPLVIGFHNDQTLAELAADFLNREFTRAGES